VILKIAKSKNAMVKTNANGNRKQIPLAKATAGLKKCLLVLEISYVSQHIWQKKVCIASAS